MTAPAFSFTPRDRTSFRNRKPPLDAMASELALRRYQLEQEAEERKVDEAYAKYAPGTKLFVQSKTIPQRRRAGIVFSNKARVEVTVVDASDDDVAKAVINGQTVVTPMGAKQIVEDAREDGGALIVFEGPGTNANANDGRVTELETQLADKDAELAQARAELAALRGKRNDPDAVKPERLAKNEKAKPDDKTVVDARDPGLAPTGKDIAGGK